MGKIFNLDESNLSITIKVADLRTVINEINEEWAKRVAEAKKEVEKQEWYSTKETAKIFNKSISTINRWKNDGYLPAKTIGGRDYYAKKDIEVIMGAA